MKSAIDVSHINFQGFMGGVGKVLNAGGRCWAAGVEEGEGGRGKLRPTPQGEVAAPTEEDTGRTEICIIAINQIE